MRKRATVLASLDGLSRPAFVIAQELSQNNRSGLTVRFLSKKLDLPMEEVEYLVDLHPDLFFLDLTRVRITREAASLMRRVERGLENRGDIRSLYDQTATLNTAELVALTSYLGLDPEQVYSKRALADWLLQEQYHQPESLVSYVGSQDFSSLAKEIFDALWQSEQGVLTATAIRALMDRPDTETERALGELIAGFAVFEMFRFDEEDRLVRVIALLEELRACRASASTEGGKKPELKRVEEEPEEVVSFGVHVTKQVCRLVAAVAGKPARLRADGELYREDFRRLEPLFDEEDVPLYTCLWYAEALEWVGVVDRRVVAAELDGLVAMSWAERHWRLVEWVLRTAGSEAASLHFMREFAGLLEDGAWYSVDDFAAYVVWREARESSPILAMDRKGRWRYASPRGGAAAERTLKWALEEGYLWLGLVDMGAAGGREVFRLTPLGRWLFSGGGEAPVTEQDSAPAEIVVQPNFDIIVPVRDVDPLVTVPLEQFAEPHGAGHAQVYRLTKASVTRALQSGHNGEAFLNFLVKHNRSGSLPENVATTLEEWFGSVKRVRLKTLHVIESDDPLVIAELLHRKPFAQRLSKVDPNHTVAYSKISKKELMKRLEKDGFIIE